MAGHTVRGGIQFTVSRDKLSTAGAYNMLVCSSALEWAKAELPEPDPIPETTPVSAAAPRVGDAADELLRTRGCAQISCRVEP
jgi:hypothetical protein